MKNTVRKVISLLLCAMLVLTPFAVGAVSDDDPMSLPSSSGSLKRAAVTPQEAYAHGSRFQTGYAIYDVIDVSTHNGSISWPLVAASGIKYVMIRAGYRGYTEGILNADDKFLDNVNGALAAGINVGVYFYSQAISVAEAEAEAQFTLDAMKGLNIGLPVAFDFEYAEKNGGYTGRLYNAKLSKAEVTALCNAFCDKVSQQGYTAMVYANAFSLNDLMNASGLRYGVWLAEYHTTPTYTGNYEMWQYTSKGSVFGISGNVDRSYWYIPNPYVTTPVLALSTSSMTLNKNDSAALSYVVSSDAVNSLYGNGTPGEVTFASTDSSVAVVDAAGKVQAVGKGTATITATVKVEVATQQAVQSYTHTATCLVTVIDNSGSGSDTPTGGNDNPSGGNPGIDVPSGGDTPSGDNPGGSGGSSSSSSLLDQFMDLMRNLAALFVELFNMLAALFA